MTITEAEKERGEKFWRQYNRQKYHNFIQNIFLCLTLIFAAIIFFCVLVLRFFQKQSADMLEVMIKPLTLKGIIFVSLAGITIFAVLYLRFLLQKQEHFQWFLLSFLRKDFTPSKYYVLCVYNGRFMICKVFQGTLHKVWEIDLDTLIEINLTTSQRQSSACKDDIYKGNVKVQIGFKEEEMTIPLLESIFSDKDAFLKEAKSAIINAIKAPLRDLGWEENARIEPEIIKKACAAVEVVVSKVHLYIKYISVPKNVMPAHKFLRRRENTGDSLTHRQQMEKTLRTAVHLFREKEAKEEANRL